MACGLPNRFDHLAICLGNSRQNALDIANRRCRHRAKAGELRFRALLTLTDGGRGCECADTTASTRRAISASSVATRLLSGDGAARVSDALSRRRRTVVDDGRREQFGLDLFEQYALDDATLHSQPIAAVVLSAVGLRRAPVASARPGDHEVRSAVRAAQHPAEQVRGRPTKAVRARRRQPVPHARADRCADLALAAFDAVPRRLPGSSGPLQPWKKLRRASKV